MIGAEEIGEAVAVLRRGGLVAFPTETVYGLGCDAANSIAVGRLFCVKGRPAGHPVIVHLGDAALLDEWASDVPDAARRLAAACWPGPLTIVLPRAPRVPDGVTGGRDSVALRVPDQPVALALLRAFGGGVAAPSANRFGKVSPTTAADVREDLGDDVDVVLDGGACTVGVESTIVDLSDGDPVILRLGGYAREGLERLLGQSIDLSTEGERAAPGTLPAHYAPKAGVLVVPRDEMVSSALAVVASGRLAGVLALEPPPGLPDGVVVLQPPRDVDDFARVLYMRMREADKLGLDVLLVVEPADEGVGAAVRDRLRRASGRASV